MPSKVLETCPGCGRKGLKNAAHGLCSRCATRKRREDPIQAEKDRASSRRWKHKHRGYDSRPHNDKRTDADRGQPHVYPDVTVFCAGCGIQLLDPAILCGFCKIELPSYDRLRFMELLPGQDTEWKRYFDLLSNSELDTMIRQGEIERARRLGEHFQLDVLPKNTYRKDGHGNLVGPPPHHRRCSTCGELIANCKGHSDAAT